MRQFRGRDGISSLISERIDALALSLSNLAVKEWIESFGSSAEDLFSLLTPFTYFECTLDFGSSA